MKVCTSTALNSDASENIVYNHPDFPVYIEKGQLSSYSDFRWGNVLWHQWAADFPAGRRRTLCKQPLLLSVNTYFTENCLNPLIQNMHFPYQKLNPSVQWQNSILRDLEISVFLLRNTTMSVTAIDYACGFSNSSYFCELFHKYYNTTPGRFRNNLEPSI